MTTALTSRVDPHSARFSENTAAFAALLDALESQQRRARDGGGPRAVERHRSRGRLLAQDRIDLLLDEDAPFLELSTLAAWGTEFHVGASVVTGIGVVCGTECMVIAHDPTVRAGASNP